MSVSRIKTIVIVALVLLNVFFLTVLLKDTTADARIERLAIENACFVMKSGGIDIEPDAIKANGALRTMRTARGDEAEAAIARALLGETVLTDRGITPLYENAERGTAEFYSAGDFEIIMNDGVITNSGGTLRTVRRLLRKMKLETGKPVLSGEPGNETVTAVSTLRGVSIFNCMIRFVFHGESLATVRGRYMTSVEAAEGGAEISTAGTALLGFLDAVMKEEFECKRVFGVEAGYQYRASSPFGEGVIAPAWLITADSGRYIFDDATGDIRLIA